METVVRAVIGLGAAVLIIWAILHFVFAVV